MFKSLLRSAVALLTVVVVLSSSGLFAREAAANPASAKVSPAGVNAQKTIRVTYVSPYITEFWADVQRFMEEVAKDLHIELSYIEAGSRFQTLQAAETLKTIEPKPDYVIFQYQHGLSQPLLNVTQERNIKSFVINTDIPDSERQDVGEPRGKYAHWIGQLYSDNETTGYVLADELIQLAQKKFPEQTINILAVGGELYLPVGERRNLGLKKRAEEAEHVFIKRAVFTRWREENAYRSTLELVKRYPDVNVIWAASDVLAQGSITALKELGLKPGEDVLIGSVDWTAAGLELIEKRELNLSLGGHFMEGGWALILIHDYHHGIDFKDGLGVKIDLPMQAIAAGQARKLHSTFHSGNWHSIDFARFSKHYNPQLKHYPFSLAGFFDAMDVVISQQKIEQSSEKTELPVK